MLTPKDLFYFIRLSRPINLVIGFLAYSTSTYLVSRGQNQDLFFENINYWLEGICILLIMATGYWINDIYDFKIDRINKPNKNFVNAHISRKKVVTGYLAGTLLVGAISYFLPFRFILINLTAVLLLYAYTLFLKRRSVLGNLVIALLTGIVILAGAFHYVVLPTILWLSFWAFLITFAREIVKDIEDLSGDLTFELATLPIQVGIEGSKSVIVVVYIILLISCNLPAFLLSNWQYMIVSILLVQIPLMYALVRLHRSTDPQAFRQQSLWLKWIMLGGLVSAFFL